MDKRFLIYLMVFVFSFIVCLSSVSAVNDDNNTIIQDNNDINNTIDNNNHYSVSKNIGSKKLDANSSKIIGLNSTTFDTYVSNGEFNDLVSDGDTINVNGKLDGARFALTINKSLNFISSNNQSYINVYTQSTGDYGEATGGQITFGHGSTGSNITGLYFYNTRVVFTNTSNILVNNISVIDYEANIGSGTGHFILSGGSKNITINNSYFYTKDNGQHSTMVFTGANSCVFENNTVEAVGKVGNLVYINTFNSATSDTNGNITIRNNLINGIHAEGSITCFAICIVGANHLIENNIVLYNGSSLSGIWTAADYENITIKNNNFTGGVVLSNSSGIKINSMKNINIINNTIGTLSVATANIYNNTISTLTITEDNNIVENNSLKRLIISGNNVTVNNNNISTMNDYAINITGSNVSVTNNRLASLKGRADEAITNTTEITTNNNTNTSIHFSITDSNVEKFFVRSETLKTWYLANETVDNVVFKPEDTVTISSETITILHLRKNPISNGITEGIPITLINPNIPNVKTFTAASNLTIQNYNSNTLTTFRVNGTLNMINCTCGKISTFYVYATNWNQANPVYNNSNMTIINSTITLTNIYAYVNYSTIINSTIYRVDQSKNLVIENSSILQTPENNTSICTITLSNYQGTLAFITTTGKLNETIKNYDTILVEVYSTTTSIWSGRPSMIVDKMVNMCGLPAAYINKSINFVEDSEGCVVSGITFAEPVYVNSTEYITFRNNTFEKGIVLNGASNIILENNIFTGSDTIINLTDSTSITFNNNSIINNDSSVSNDISSIILVNSNASVFKNNVISGNITAFNLTQSLNNNITDNNISVGADYTIIGDDASTNNSISKNLLTSSKGNDLKSTKLSNDNTYTDNNSTRYNTNISINFTQEGTIYVGDSVPITINVTNVEDDELVDNGYVELYAEGIYLGTYNLTNGTLNTNIIFYDAGKNITLKVWYYPYTKYYENNTYINNITITSARVSINITTSNAKVNENTTITATLTTSNNNTINEGTILFTIANTTYTANVTNSTASITTTVNTNWVDNPTIQANYTNSQNYKFTTNTTTITITPGNTKITANNITTTINTNTTLTAKITDNNGKNITNGNVSFTTSNGTILTNVAVINGTATATIIFNTTYNDNITATYNGTKYYQTNNTTFTLSTGKLNSTITVDNVRGVVLSRVTLVARVVDENGNNVTGGTVGFKINGVTLRYTNGTIVTATLVNGVARVNYTIPQGWLATGTTIMATYTGNSYVNSARSNNSSVTISRLNSTVSILTDKVTCRTGETMIIKVLVTDTDGKLVNGGQVAFKLNGLTLKDSNGKTIYVNVTNGVATLNYTIPILYGAYNYTLTAVYGGSVYNRATDNSSVELIKTNTHVDANPIKTASNKVTINARVLDGNNKQILRATTITLKLNGITYKNNITANNGILNITLDFPYKTGTYELLIIAGENSQYQSSRLTTTIQRT